MASKVRYLAVPAAAATLLFTIANPAHAAAPTPHFTVVNQVADQAGGAPLIDPDLVNAWGLAFSPTGPIWVANNGTNTATIYPGGVNGAPVTKAGLTVSIPGGAVTGQAFNDTTDFVVNAAGGSAPATFLFVSEGGDVQAWSGPVSGTTASVVQHVPGAIYKGLAVLHLAGANFILAADFHRGHIDAFDATFTRVHLPGLNFRDPNLPAGYAPFNVLAVGNKVYVAYAKQDADREDEQAGPGRGFVDVYTVPTAYTTTHPTRQRVASRGTLDAPWGLAIAPASYGRFAGALLVGNFGDGRIGAFRDGAFLGALRDPTGRRVQIPGLWGLLPGTATSGGVDTLWFSAGPGDEEHGLVGELLLN